MVSAPAPAGAPPVSPGPPTDVRAPRTTHGACRANDNLRLNSTKARPQPTAYLTAFPKTLRPNTSRAERRALRFAALRLPSAHRRFQPAFSALSSLVLNLSPDRAAASRDLLAVARACRAVSQTDLESPLGYLPVAGLPGSAPTDSPCPTDLLPPLPPISGPIGHLVLPPAPYPRAACTKVAPARPPSARSQWNDDPRLWRFLSSITNRGCGTLLPLPMCVPTHAPLDPCEFVPVHLLPRSAVKSILVWDDRWQNAAYPWQDTEPPELSSWPRVIAFLLSLPPQFAVTVQQLDWSAAYWSIIRTDGRQNACLTLCPASRQWYVFRTDRVGFGQHDAVSVLWRLHQRWLESAACALPPGVPPPVTESHVDDLLTLAWRPDQVGYLPAFASLGEADGMVSHPTKSALSPSRAPTVYVGKLVDPVSRAVTNPPASLALGCLRVFGLLDRPWLGRRASQRLCGILVFLTSHTRYLRSPALAAFYRASSRHPFRVTLCRGLRHRALVALAAAFLPLVGAMLSPTVAPFWPSCPLAFITFCDAQVSSAPRLPDGRRPHAAAAFVLLSTACISAGEHAPGCPCRLQAVRVPLRFSAHQAHAEAFGFLCSVAALRPHCPDLTPPHGSAGPAPRLHAACGADATASLGGLAALRAPAFSKPIAPLVTRLSRLLARYPICGRAFKCPGGDGNPVDAVVRHQLSLLNLASSTPSPLLHQCTPQQAPAEHTRTLALALNFLRQ